MFPSIQVQILKWNMNFNLHQKNTTRCSTTILKAHHELEKGRETKIHVKEYPVSFLIENVVVIKNDSQAHAAMHTKNKTHTSQSRMRKSRAFR